MKKLNFIPVIYLLFTLVFTGCLDTEKGRNFDEYRNQVVVVGYNDRVDAPTIIFERGEVVANILEPAYQEKGTCLGASFEIDYDEQPAGSYLSATKLLAPSIEIPQSDYIEDVNFDSDSPVWPIRTLQYQYYANQLGRVFFVTEADPIDEGQRLNYRLVYVPKDGDAEKGSIKDVYMYAEVEGEASGISQENSVELNAYNLNHLFRLGSDTIIRSFDTEIPSRYIRLNLRYFAGIRNEQPQWVAASGSATKPIELLMYKKDQE